MAQWELHPDVARALAEREARWLRLALALTMGAPWVEQEGERVYLVDAIGVRWRVHDATFANYRSHRVALGDPRATYRHFVNAEGVRRVLKLAPLTSRALDVVTLARQLAASEYAASGPPHDPPADPR